MLADLIALQSQLCHSLFIAQNKTAPDLPGLF